MTQAENRNITNLSGRTVRAGLSNRRSFTGGSDARIIMGTDEAALLRLWREKRGEAEREDLSGNLIVQLGTVTEPLNRQWRLRCGSTYGLLTRSLICASWANGPSGDGHRALPHSHR